MELWDVSFKDINIFVAQVCPWALFFSHSYEWISTCAHKRRHNIRIHPTHPIFVVDLQLPGPFSTQHTDTRVCIRIKRIRLKFRWSVKDISMKMLPAERCARACVWAWMPCCGTKPVMENQKFKCLFDTVGLHKVIQWLANFSTSSKLLLSHSGCYSVQLIIRLNHVSVDVCDSYTTVTTQFKLWMLNWCELFGGHSFSISFISIFYGGTKLSAKNLTVERNNFCDNNLFYLCKMKLELFIEERATIDRGQTFQVKN